MIEAEITCECPAIQLADLQMALTKGMVVYLDADAARRSEDLQRAVRARGVSIKHVQRFRERRPEAAVPVHPIDPPSAAPRGVSSETPWSATDLDALADRIASRVTSRIEDVLKQALGAVLEADFPRHVASHDPPRGSSAPATSAADAIPVFIPSKIGRDDMRPAFELPVVKAGDEGVTEALAALKAARKRTK